MVWDKADRRMHGEVVCSQEQTIQTLREDALNHKEWRKETSSVLSGIHIQLATMNERLRYKTAQMEDHINQGKFWRGSMFSMGLVLALNIAGTIWWGDTIQNDIGRLKALHPYGSAMQELAK